MSESLAQQLAAPRQYRLDPEEKSLGKQASHDRQSLMDVPHCTHCQGKAEQDATLSVKSDFMAEQLISEIHKFATSGTCLFCRLALSLHDSQNTDVAIL
jgi:hypothetical protein